MLYIIVFRIRGDDTSTREIVTTIQDLFMTCIILNNSERVIEFKVYYGGGLINEKVFSWGKIEKWVMKFNWKKGE